MSDIHTRLKIENSDTTIYPVCDYNDMINKPSIPTIPRNIVTFEPVGAKAQLKSGSGANLDPITSGGGSLFRHYVRITGNAFADNTQFIVDLSFSFYDTNNIAYTKNSLPQKSYAICGSMYEYAETEYRFSVLNGLDYQLTNNNIRLNHGYIIPTDIQVPVVEPGTARLLIDGQLNVIDNVIAM